MVDRSTRPLPGRSAPRLVAASRQERRCREAVVCVSSSDLAPLVVMNLGSSVPTSPGMGQWRADGW